jgi:uncharacterized membrane protein
MAQALGNEEAERAAVLFYGATLLAISLVLGALWRGIVSDKSLIAASDADKMEDFKALGGAIIPGIVLYVVATAIAFVAPTLGVWGYLLIALVLLVRVHPRKEAADRAEVS